MPQEWSTQAISFVQSSFFTNNAHSNRLTGSSFQTGVPWENLSSQTRLWSCCSVCTCWGWRAEADQSDTVPQTLLTFSSLFPLKEIYNSDQNQYWPFLPASYMDHQLLCAVRPGLKLTSTLSVLTTFSQGPPFSQGPRPDPTEASWLISPQPVMACFILLSL